MLESRIGGRLAGPGRQMEKRFVSRGGTIGTEISPGPREHFATVNARGTSRRAGTRFFLEHERRIRESITIRSDVKCVRRQLELLNLRRALESKIQKGGVFNFR